MKICKRCHVPMEVERFYVKEEMRDGRFNVCKKCLSVEAKFNRAQSFAIEHLIQSLGRLFSKTRWVYGRLED